MSRRPIKHRAWAVSCLLVAGVGPAVATEAALQAVDAGNGQRMLVDGRQLPATTAAPVTDTMWVNGQAVRVLREPGIAISPAEASTRTMSAGGSRSATTDGATAAKAGVPRGAQAVSMPNGSKMWVLPER